MERQGVSSEAYNRGLMNTTSSSFGRLLDSGGLPGPSLMAVDNLAGSYEQQILSHSTDWEILTTNSLENGEPSPASRPVRRIKYSEQTTGHNKNSSVHSNASGLAQQERLQAEGQHIDSLHGLSLSTKKQTEPEVLSRSDHGTPEFSSNSVVFAATCPTANSANTTPKKMSKNAKKRQKKREKKRQTQVTCLGMLCTNTESESQKGEEENERVDYRQSQQQAVAQLLDDSIPNTSIRFYRQGIQNLGSTCFLGSAMQFLLASPDFCCLVFRMGSAQRFLDAIRYPFICSMGQLAVALKPIPEVSDQNRASLFKLILLQIEYRWRRKDSI